MANSSNKLTLISDSGMVAGANVLYNNMVKFAPYKKIKDSIFISRVSGTDKSRSITVSINMNEKTGGAPYARAFDIGSGIHGKLGQTYTILPKNKNALWFPYPASKIYPGAVRYTKNGQLGITTLEVHHPGVKGVGYTKKAVKQSRGEIKDVIGREALKGIRLYLKASFEDVGKKK